MSNDKKHLNWDSGVRKMNTTPILPTPMVWVTCCYCRNTDGWLYQFDDGLLINNGDSWVCGPCIPQYDRQQWLMMDDDKGK